MSELQLTKLTLRNSVWEGLLTAADGATVAPEVRVTYLDQPLSNIEVSAFEKPGQWLLRIPVPPRAIADGVQTFLILDPATDSKLGEFTLIAGEAAGDDLRAEVGLLRAELDMLKRAFRRHCLETM